MADSFADIWNSTAPTKPKPPPQTLGSASRTTPQQTSSSPSLTNASNDLFNRLASSSQPTSRQSTPSGPYSSTPSTRPGYASNRSNGIDGLRQPTAHASSSSPALPLPSGLSKTPSRPSSASDAFSALLSGSLAASSSSSLNGTASSMSMADRHAEAQQARLAQAERERAARAREHAVWDGLDIIGGGRSSSAASAPVDDFDFSVAPVKTGGSTGTASKPPASSVLSDDDDWAFANAVPTSSTKRSNAGKPSISTPIDVLGDFDFGDREDLEQGDRLLSRVYGDDDDILGVLGKPIDRSTSQANAERTGTPSNATPPQTTTSRTSSRAVSPPPHIVGQIVEMGFSPQQARVALAATETGLDVQAALEILLQNSGEDSNAGEDRGLRFVDDDDHESPRPPPTRANTNPNRGRPPPQRLDTTARTGSPPKTSTTGASAADLQERADKLLAQASEIGLSMFSRANALWREGKDRVQRVYEERAAASAAGSGVASPGGGSGQDEGGSRRPKWMVDAPAMEHEEGKIDGSAAGGFRDEDGNVQEAPRRRAASAAALQKVPQAARLAVAHASLFDADATAYVSPARHSRRQKPARTSTSSSATPASAPTPPIAVPEPLRTRRSPSATPSQLETHNTHKAQGTELFKLGRYAEAEAAYTSALAALPVGHLFSAPLLTNRALALLRMGEYGGAEADCKEVIELVGKEYDPAREERVKGAECGEGVDLGAALVKAYRRRAEAYEGREKWELALKDWEALVGLGAWAAGLRGDAVTASGRCRRMVKMHSETVLERVDDGDGGATQDLLAAAFEPASTRASPKPAAPKPKPSTSSTPTQTQTYEAVSKLRAQHAAQEAEEAERVALKDAVDSRLLAWKGGKESNLRALLASLDIVLWPSLGWKSVGMAELVSSGQVKVRYTRAIAKVHPDKLDVNKTTLEQRMIANGVFAALNEAWVVFKQ